MANKKNTARRGKVNSKKRKAQKESAQGEDAPKTGSDGSPEETTSPRLQAVHAHLNSQIPSNERPIRSEQAPPMRAGLAATDEMIMPPAIVRARHEAGTRSSAALPEHVGMDERNRRDLSNGGGFNLTPGPRPMSAGTPEVIITGAPPGFEAHRTEAMVSSSSAERSSTFRSPRRIVRMPNFTEELSGREQASEAALPSGSRTVNPPRSRHPAPPWWPYEKTRTQERCGIPLHHSQPWLRAFSDDVLCSAAKPSVHLTLRGNSAPGLQPSVRPAAKSRTPGGTVDEGGAGEINLSAMPASTSHLPSVSHVPSLAPSMLNQVNHHEAPQADTHTHQSVITPIGATLPGASVGSVTTQPLRQEINPVPATPVSPMGRPSLPPVTPPIVTDPYHHVQATSESGQAASKLPHHPNKPENFEHPEHFVHPEHLNSQNSSREAPQSHPAQSSILHDSPATSGSVLNGDSAAVAQALVDREQNIKRREREYRDYCMKLEDMVAHVQAELSGHAQEIRAAAKVISNSQFVKLFEELRRNPLPRSNSWCSPGDADLGPSGGLEQSLGPSEFEITKWDRYMEYLQGRERQLQIQEENLIKEQRATKRQKEEVDLLAAALERDMQYIAHKERFLQDAVEAVESCIGKDVFRILIGHPEEAQVRCRTPARPSTFRSPPATTHWVPRDTEQVPGLPTPLHLADKVPVRKPTPPRGVL